MRLPTYEVVARTVGLKAVHGAIALDATCLLKLEDSLECLVTRACDYLPFLQSTQAQKQP